MTYLQKLTDEIDTLEGEIAKRPAGDGSPPSSKDPRRLEWDLATTGLRDSESSWLPPKARPPANDVAKGLLGSLSESRRLADLERQSERERQIRFIQNGIRARA